MITILASKKTSHSNGLVFWNVELKENLKPSRQRQASDGESLNNTGYSKERPRLGTKKPGT